MGVQKHPLQNRTNVQTKGGGSKAFWTMFKKTALFNVQKNCTFLTGRLPLVPIEKLSSKETYSLTYLPHSTGWSGRFHQNREYRRRNRTQYRMLQHGGEFRDFMDFFRHVIRHLRRMGSYGIFKWIRLTVSVDSLLSTKAHMCVGH